MNADSLPAYEDISNKPLREAAGALSAARAALDASRKDRVQLEQELPNAQQEDAKEDERRLHEGKPRLKGLPATKRHEDAIASAAHGGFQGLTCSLLCDLSGQNLMQTRP